MGYREKERESVFVGGRERKCVRYGVKKRGRLRLGKGERVCVCLCMQKRRSV